MKRRIKTRRKPLIAPFLFIKRRLKIASKNQRPNTIKHFHNDNLIKAKQVN